MAKEFSIEEFIAQNQAPDKSIEDFITANSIQTAAQAEPSSFKRGVGTMMSPIGTTLKQFGATGVGQAMQDTGDKLIVDNPAETKGITDAITRPFTTMKESAVEMSPQLIAQAVLGTLGGVIGKRFGGTAGAVLGAKTLGSIPTFLAETGGVIREQEQNGQVDMPRALAAGAASTAVEFVSGIQPQVAKIASKLITGQAAEFIAKEGVKGVLREGVKQGLKSSFGEGIEEYPQQVITDIGARKDPFTKEATMEGADSVVRAFMGSLPLGIAAGSVNQNVQNNAIRAAEQARLAPINAERERINNIAAQAQAEARARKVEVEQERAKEGYYNTLAEQGDVVGIRFDNPKFKQDLTQLASQKVIDRDTPVEKVEAITAKVAEGKPIDLAVAETNRELAESRIPVLEQQLTALKEAKQPTADVDKELRRAKRESINAANQIKAFETKRKDLTEKVEAAANGTAEEFKKAKSLLEKFEAENEAKTSKALPALQRLQEDMVAVRDIRSAYDAAVAERTADQTAKDQPTIDDLYAQREAEQARAQAEQEAALLRSVREAQGEQEYQSALDETARQEAINAQPPLATQLQTPEIEQKLRSVVAQADVARAEQAAAQAAEQAKAATAAETTSKLTTLFSAAKGTTTPAQAAAQIRTAFKGVDMTDPAAVAAVIEKKANAGNVTFAKIAEENPDLVAPLRAAQGEVSVTTDGKPVVTPVAKQQTEAPAQQAAAPVQPEAVPVQQEVNWQNDDDALTAELDARANDMTNERIIREDMRDLKSAIVGAKSDPVNYSAAVAAARKQIANVDAYNAMKSQQPAPSQVEVVKKLRKIVDSQNSSVEASREANSQLMKFNAKGFKATDADLQQAQAVVDKHIGNSYSVGVVSNPTTVQAVTASFANLFKRGSSNLFSVYESVAEAVAANPALRKAKIREDASAVVINGKAYFFTRNIQQGRERGIIMHELGSHIGIESIMSAGQIKSLADTVRAWASGNSAESRFARKALVRVERAGTNFVQQDAETIAYFIEEAVNAGITPNNIKTSSKFGQWIRSVFNAFKKALAKLGITEYKNMTGQDLVDMAYGAASIQIDKATGRVNTDTSYSADVAPIFFSALRRAVDSTSTKKASAEGWMNAIKGMLNKGVVKADELEWTGINEWLRMQQGAVTKEQVQEYLDANGVQVEERIYSAQNKYNMYDLESMPPELQRIVAPMLVPGTGRDWDAFHMDLEDAGYKVVDSATDFETYIMKSTSEPTQYEDFFVPGSDRKDYKELLLKLPVKNKFESFLASMIEKYKSAAWFGVATDAEKKRFMELQSDNPALFDGAYVAQREDFETFAVYGNSGIQISQTFKTLDEANEWLKTEKSFKTGPYKSSHWRDKNVIAHIRFDQRVDADGKVTLFVNELQSDWAQDGRKVGFNRSREDIIKASKEIRDEKYALEKELDELDAKIEKASERVSWLFANRQGANGWGEKLNVARTERASLYDRREQAYEKISDLNQQLFRLRNAPTISKAPFVERTDAWVSLALKRIIRYAIDNGFDKVAIATGTQAAQMFKLSKAVDKITWSNQVTTNKPVVKVSFKEAANIKFIVNRENGIIESNLDGASSLVGQDLRDVIGTGLAEVVISEKYGELQGDGIDIGGDGMKGFYDQIIPKNLKNVLSKVGGKIETVSVSMGKGVIDGMPTIGNVYSDQVGFTITPEMRNSVQQGLPLFSIPEYAMGSGAAALNDVLNGVVLNDPSITGVMSRFYNMGVKDSLEVLKNKFSNAMSYINSPLHMRRQSEGYRNSWDHMQDMVSVAKYIQNEVMDSVQGEWIQGRLGNTIKDFVTQSKSQMTQDTQAAIAHLNKWNRDRTAPQVDTTAPWYSKVVAFRKAVDSLLETQKITELESLRDNIQDDVEYEKVQRRVYDHYERLKAEGYIPDRGRGPWSIGLYSKEMLNGEYPRSGKGLIKRFMFETESEARAALRELKDIIGDDDSIVMDTVDGKPVMLSQEAIKMAQNNTTTLFQFFELAKQAGVTMSPESRSVLIAKLLDAESMLHNSIQNRRNLLGGQQDVIRALAEMAVNTSVAVSRARVMPRIMASLNNTSQLSEGERLDLITLRARFAQYSNVAEASARKSIMDTPDMSLSEKIKTLSDYNRMLKYDAWGYDRWNGFTALETAELDELRSREGQLTPEEERRKLELSTPKTADSAKYNDEAKRLLASLIDPTPDGLAALRKIAALNFLGGSAASALLNLTSIPMFLAPVLYGHSGFGAYSTIAGVTARVSAGLADKNSIFGALILHGNDGPLRAAIAPGGTMPSWLTRDMAQSLLRAFEEGLIAEQQTYDLYALDKYGVNSANIFTHKAAQAWMAPFRITEAMNRVVAFQAAYETGAAKGMSGEALYDFSREIVNDTMFVYGRLGRPAMARNSVGLAFMTFRMFPLMAVELIAHMKGSQRTIMLGSLLLASGLNGIPGGDDLKDIIDTVMQRVFGKPFNSNRVIHNYMKVATEAVTGYDLSDLIMYGGLDSLTDASLGARMALSNLVPGTRMAVAGQDLSRNLEEITGAVGSEVAGWVQGAKALMQGDTVRAWKEAAPASAKRWTQAYEAYSTGKLTDINGNKMVDEVTTYEIALLGMGFSLARQHTAFQNTRQVTDPIAFALEQKQEFKRELMQGMENKDAKQIRDTNELIRAWNLANPEYKIEFNRSILIRDLRAKGLTPTERNLKTIPREWRKAAAEELENEE